MRQKNIILILIIFTGLILRLVNLNQSFWLDEAAQVLESIRPLSQQLKITSDFHPPLFHLMLRFWMYLGKSEIWVRLLSVLLGVGSIFMLYKLALALFKSEKVALLSSLFLALSPYHLWYSQEARPYMLFVLTSLLSTFFLIKKKWIFYTAATVFLFYSLYFAPFLILGQIVYFFFSERKSVGKFLGSLFLSIIFFIPWLPEFIKQLSRGINGSFSGWTGVVSVTSFKVIPLTFAKFIFGKGSIDSLLLYSLVLLPVFSIFTVSSLRIWKKKEEKISLILFIVPLFAAFITSLILPVAAPQRLIFLLPVFLLIIARGISSFSKIFRLVAIAIVVITSFAGTLDYYLNPYVQREQWRQVVSFIEEKGDKNTMAIFVFPSPFAPYLWYSRNIIESAGIAPQFILRNEDLNNLLPIIGNKEKIYLFQYLTGLTDPKGMTANFLKSQGYKNNLTRDFPGVGFVYVYEKT